MIHYRRLKAGERPKHGDTFLRKLDRRKPPGEKIGLFGSFVRVGRPLTKQALTLFKVFRKYDI